MPFVQFRLKGLTREGTFRSKGACRLLLSIGQRRLALFVAAVSIYSLAAQTTSTLEGPTIPERNLRQRAEAGEVEISLAWNGCEDLDLHAECQDTEIYYGRKDACGGHLDVDMNASACSLNSVEHIVWKNRPPRGTYAISVVLFNRKGQSARTIPFEVQVKLKGEDSPRTFPGSVSTEGQKVQVYSWRIE